ncbi:MAG: hypothetical protein U1F83_06455 [Verrucomicrobiota bacterium]
MLLGTFKIIRPPASSAGDAHDSKLQTPKPERHLEITSTPGEKHLHGVPGATVGPFVVGVHLELSLPAIGCVKLWTAPPYDQYPIHVGLPCISSSKAARSFAGTNGSSAPWQARTSHLMFLPSAGVGDPARRGS